MKTWTMKYEEWNNVWNNERWRYNIEYQWYVMKKMKEN